MKLIFAVGIGGAIGSVLRYLVNRIFITYYPQSSLPYATFTVNIVGSLAIGILMAWSVKDNVQEWWKPLLITGLCGGFTTFSALTMESLTMLKEGRIGIFFLYISFSIILGLFATFLGYKLVAG